MSLRRARSGAPGRSAESRTAGLFGPRSITWKVNRESVLLLGGGRALLMQIAHPLVAAGVAEHSDFKNDPFARLRRTLDTMYAVTFGTAEEARHAWRSVDAIHRHVKGTLAAKAGNVAAGTVYRARDPELLLWVHATLVDTSMCVYRRYVDPLEREDWERYYRESKSTARLFGIPAALVPADLRAFERYVERTVGELCVTDTARDLAESVLRPPLPLIPTAAFEILNLVTVGLLPDRLRRGFGFAWGAGRQLLLDASGVAIRRLLPLLPDLLRTAPAVRAAERRVAIAG